MLEPHENTARTQVAPWRLPSGRRRFRITDALAIVCCEQAAASRLACDPKVRQARRRGPP
jgi:hypothetical protein